MLPTNFKKGDPTRIWIALYFFLSKNPRLTRFNLDPSLRFFVSYDRIEAITAVFLVDAVPTSISLSSTTRRISRLETGRLNLSISSTAISTMVSLTDFISDSACLPLSEIRVLEIIWKIIRVKRPLYDELLTNHGG